jgi:hypothetical protein
MTAELGAAVVRARARVRDSTARAFARASALGVRVVEARRRQEALVQHAATLRRASRAERARSRRIHWSRHQSVDRFVVEGLIDGQEVRAAWSGRRLACDESLLARALLLVDLEEEFVYDDPPRCFVATVEGPPIAVALTLIRACDRVTRISLAPA